MIADYFRSPSVAIALISKWEEKLKQLATSTINDNVVSLAGVPSWMLILLQKILKDTGKNPSKKFGPTWKSIFTVV